MRLLIILSLFASACGSSTSTSPSHPPPTSMSYDINVPTGSAWTGFVAEYPNGVITSPVAAQAAFNFTVGGVPNVYYGEVLPPPGMYKDVGIVVAPLSAASKDIFHGSDWPALKGDPAQAYQWVGRFVITPVVTR